MSQSWTSTDMSKLFDRSAADHAPQHGGRDGAGNLSVSLDHADGGARPERRVADDVGHREHDDSATDRERRPGREGRRGRDVGRPAHLDSRASTAGRARSSIVRVLAATCDVASMAAALNSLPPAPPSASSTHFRSRRRCCPAQSRIDPDLDLTSSDDGTDDRRLLRVARAWERLGPILRPRITRTAADVDCTIHRCDARSARWSLPVGSNCEPGEAAPRDRTRRFDASLVQRNLPAGVDACESASRRCESRTRGTPQPAAFQKPHWGTPSPLPPEPARRRSRGCRRLRRRGVDEAGPDRIRDVDGLGDKAVYGALQHAVAP